MPLPDATLKRFAHCRVALKDDAESLRDLNAILTEMSGYRAKLESTASVFAHFMPKRY